MVPANTYHPNFVTECKYYFSEAVKLQVGPSLGRNARTGRNWWGNFSRKHFYWFSILRDFLLFPNTFSSAKYKICLGRKESCCSWGYHNMLSQDKLDMIFRAKNSMSGKCRRPPRTCLNMSGPGPQYSTAYFRIWILSSSALGNKPFPLSSASCVPLAWYPALAMYDCMIHEVLKIHWCEKKWETEIFVLCRLLVTCVLAWQKGTIELVASIVCMDCFPY